MKRSNRRLFLTGFSLALAVIIAALSIYIGLWYAERRRVEADGARYHALYATAEPGSEATPAAATTSAPSETDPAAADPAPAATDALPRAEDEPIPTPDADTLVLALPTPPQARERFHALLAVNPDTVGFLTLGDDLSLPVVHRKNDNSHYLDHGFDGGEAREGALFLDGSNRLTPEDGCLIVYGHNMKNGTMFGSLHRFGGLTYLKAHAAVRFDTLYEDRVYVPFAAFAASMDPAADGYFEVRRFPLEGDAFDSFAAELRGRSQLDIPVPVARGDRLLLLVTCDSSARDGRFILALRQLRKDETEADAAAMVASAVSK